MRLSTRPILRRVALTGAALLAATAAVPQASAAAAPDDRTAAGGGLSAVIRYTENGVPHILARDYAHLGFGTGWAQDLSSDLYFKGVRESGTVEKLLATPAPAGPTKDLEELMRGWAAGYNAWLAQNKITDPACKGAGWVRPVTTADVAARGFAVSVLGGQGRGIDGITAAPAPGPRGLADRPHGNPHYPWHGGRRFWQFQQTIPGELNVSGAFLLGTAVVNIGFDEKVAWSHTVATGTPVNLHQLALDPADPTTYLVDGTPERMTRRTVTVPVAGGAPVTRTQWWTRYGPVVSTSARACPCRGPRRRRTR